MNSMLKILLLIFVSFIYLTLLKTFTDMYQADVNFVKADKHLSQGDLSMAQEKINLAILQNPYEPGYYRQRAKIYIATTIDTNEETRIYLKDKALFDLALSHSLNPKNLATIRNNVPLYFFLSNEDLTKPSTEDNIEEAFFPITEDYFNLTKDLYPNDAGVQVTVAKYERRLGMEEEHKQTLNNINNLRPDLLDWHPDIQQ